jgi:hypothetical protein
LPPSLRIRSSHTASSLPPSLLPHIGIPNITHTHISERLVYIYIPVP